MDTVLREVASNAGWAAALALGAALAGLVLRARPHLVHGLWLLVLLKLVTPSLVHLAPRWGPQPTTSEPAAPRSSVEIVRVADIPGPPAVKASDPPSRLAAASPERHDRVAARPWPWPWRMTVVVLWLGGVAVWWMVVGLQVSGFRRLLRSARPAPEGLRARAGRLAGLMGVRRAPAVWLVPAAVPPMLWAPIGRPILLLPEALWVRLDPLQQDTVLAHELAHLRRRDHWVRRLEAVILGLYWWDPVAWWARRRVEQAEEQCCDSWVLQVLPKAAESYAEALVATAVFLSGTRATCPVGATGVGRVPPLRRRLTMILREPNAGLTVRPASRAAFLGGVLLLLVLPAWGLGRAPEPARRVPSVQARGMEERPEPEPRPVALAADATKVKVSRPIVREVSDYEDFTGRVEASRMIEIRPRISGYLVKAYARAGAVIETGKLLFEIDPRPYQAELDKAEAEVQRAEAQLRRRIAEMKRAKSLEAGHRISKEELEGIKGDLEEAEASLRVSQATRDLAKLKLESTKITSPIRGKISRPLLAVGSLAAAETTVLATIDSLDPMDVGFDVDERTFLRLSRERPEGKAKSALEPGLPVLVGLADDDGFPRRGRIDSVGSRFDPNTGTLPCRAVVSNPDGLLVPGLRASVRLVVRDSFRALLVAENVVLSTDQGQKYVFVVDDRGVVESRLVKLGQLRGRLQVVKEGLKESDWVIVESVDPVHTGLTVTPERVPMPGGSEAPTTERAR